MREFLSRALDDAEADDWFAGHVTHYEAAWTLFPDVLPALDRLATDYRHAILSNSSTGHQHRKLTALGVRDRFEAMVCAVELGISKPEAGAFHAACEALALSRTKWRTWATNRTSTRAAPSPPDSPASGSTAGAGADAPVSCGSPGSTSCGAAGRRYPFWSAGHLRVMFFLRRPSGRKIRPGSADRSEAPTRVAFQWAMV